MTELFFLVEEAPEGGWTARALGESIFTEGENLDDLKASIKEAVELHFDEADRPRILRLHIVKNELITL